MIVAFTGHRPERIEGRVNEVYSAIQSFLMETNPSLVISGMAGGVDQLAAGWARALNIPWIAAIPFPGQHLRWPTKHQVIYEKLLESAQRIEIISESYDRAVYQRRDEWMVDNCDLLAAVWDGEKRGGTYNTIRYAERVGREVRYLKWR